MRPNNPIFFQGVDASVTTQTSKPVPSTYLYTGSIQAVFSGTPSGALQIQVSNDSGANLVNSAPVNWSNLGSPVTVTSGALTLIILPNPPFCFAWMQVVWTHSGGSGTMIVSGSFAGSS